MSMRPALVDPDNLSLGDLVVLLSTAHFSNERRVASVCSVSIVSFTAATADAHLDASSRSDKEERPRGACSQDCAFAQSVA